MPDGQRATASFDLKMGERWVTPLMAQNPAFNSVLGNTYFWLTTTAGNCHIIQMSVSPLITDDHFRTFLSSLRL